MAEMTKLQIEKAIASLVAVSPARSALGEAEFNEVLTICQCRVAELEAAGKEALVPLADRVERLSDQVAIQDATVETVKAKIERLIRRDDEVRAWCKKHKHHVNSQYTNPPSDVSRL